MLPVAIVLDLPRGGLPGAQPRAARPRLRPARRAPASIRRLRRSLRGLRARGLPPRPRPDVARGGRGGRRSSGSRCGTTAATSTGRSTSSATSTAAATSWSELLGELGLRSAGWTRRRPARTPPARAARRSSSATWSTAARASSTCCALVHGHGRGRDGAVRARQPRREAAAEAARAATCRSPRPGRDAGAARRRETGGRSASEVARLPRRARQPLRARRRQAGRRPRRA